MNEEELYHRASESDRQRMERDPTFMQRLRESRLIREAFFLGIAHTVEGFNGECLFEHLAPRWCSSTFLIRQNDAARKLADECVKEMTK